MVFIKDCISSDLTSFVTSSGDVAAGFTGSLANNRKVQKRIVWPTAYALPTTQTLPAQHS
ncbi:hypothetical protein GYH30_033993 [Glycine max]|nr:hypothetical protein GYH30_033993 [Glycine max]